MNKCIFIAGASSGIGKALAELYASKGYSLQLTARDFNQLLLQIKQLQQKYQVKIEGYELDVTKFNSIKKLSEDLHCVPDVMICSIGYLGENSIDFVDHSDMNLIYQTNALGSIQLLNTFAQKFIERGSGTIVGISSIAGERGKAKNLYYSSAKAAFTNYLDGLRNKLVNQNIHAITVKPGYVDTRMVVGLNVPKYLVVSPEYAALSIYEAIRSKKNIAYVPSIWRLIMWMVRSIPESIFKKIKW